jgi:hypothetical protein
VECSNRASRFFFTANIGTVFVTWVVSLSSLVEEAVLGSDSWKRSSGNVLDPEALLNEESLHALEQSFPGVFAFLAFHPGGDRVVREYLETGTLSTDSGPNVLVLFTLSVDAGAPMSVTEDAFADWLHLDRQELPSQRLVRELFEPGLVPPLPGVLVFDAFLEPGEAIYLDLSAASTVDDLRQLLRSAFALLDQAVRDASKGKRSVADRFAVAAQQQRLRIYRSGRVSMRQWLVQAYQFVGDHSGDIVAAIGLGLSPPR